MVDQGTQQPTSSLPVGPEVASNDKTMAALAYILPFIGSAIILLSETNKARRYQRFHGQQGLGLGVVYVAFEIVITILSLILGTTTCGLGCVLQLIGILPIAPILYFAYQAYQGKVFDVPFITNFMVQQGWLQRI